MTARWPPAATLALAGAPSAAFWIAIVLLVCATLFGPDITVTVDLIARA